MTIQTEARNASLTDLLELLKRQQDVKIDAVVPATNIRVRGGEFRVKGMSVVEDELALNPTENFDNQVAAKLGIPGQYLKTLREKRLDLYGSNINGWLHGGVMFTEGEPGTRTEITEYPSDHRKFLVRAFSDPEGGPGIARSISSDKFNMIDNLDVLFAALEGIKESGVSVNLVSGNLSEKRMSLLFSAPEVAVLAPEFLRNYRSPFATYEPGQEPIVFAGFQVDNSETGGSAFVLTPRLTVQICSNGLKVNADAIRKIHLGQKMDTGIVTWAADTQRKNAELVSLQTRDAVKSFLTPEYVEGAIASLEKKAATPLENADEAVEFVGKKLAYSETEQNTILEHFIRGGQVTAGGILQAVTSAAQTLANPDRAWHLEDTAIQAMELVA